MNQMQLIEQFLDEKIHLIATELSLFFSFFFFSTIKRIHSSVGRVAVSEHICTEHRALNVLWVIRESRRC